MGSNTTSGAIQGAAAGAQVGGVYGAIIGLVAGGIMGSQADKKAKEARRLIKKANALRTDSAMLRSFSEQRLLLRQAQLAQATTIAAGVASGAELDSSGTQGVFASIQQQKYDNFLLGQSILNEQLDANSFETSAQKLLGQEKDIMGLLTLGTQVASLIPVGGGGDGTRKNNAGQTVYPGGTFQNSQTGGSIFGSAFDTSLVTPGGIQTVNSGGAFDA